MDDFCLVNGDVRSFGTPNILHTLHKRSTSSVYPFEIGVQEFSSHMDLVLGVNKFIYFTTWFVYFLWNYASTQNYFCEMRDFDVIAAVVKLTKVTVHTVCHNSQMINDIRLALRSLIVTIVIFSK